METEGCTIPETKEKEGSNLLGEPHFEDIGNGRLRCIETGHELPSKDTGSYISSKKCRTALIEHGLSRKIAPLNFFDQSPLDKRKLICRLTGDIINKTEEHIWKHINGRKFLKKLDEKEEGKEEKKMKNGSKLKKIRTTVNKKRTVKSGMSDSTPDSDPNSQSDSEEPEFWIPPVGSRWDFDDGGYRWKEQRSSNSRYKNGTEEMDHDINSGDEGVDGAEDITIRTKRMSVVVGPSSFASQKKKIRKNNDASVLQGEQAKNK